VALCFISILVFTFLSDGYMDGLSVCPTYYIVLPSTSSVRYKTSAPHLFTYNYIHKTENNPFRWQLLSIQLRSLSVYHTTHLPSTPPCYNTLAPRFLTYPTAYGLRFTVYGLRSTVYGLRLAIQHNIYKRKFVTSENIPQV
jgi:hypothetical protein